MRIRIVFKRPADDLDPRIATTVAAWIAKAPSGPPVDGATLHAVATELAAELAHPKVALDGGAITVDDPGEGVTYRFERLTATCDVEDPENEWSLLEKLCKRTGWVGFDAQAGKVLVGYDLVCACESSIRPHEATCNVCGAAASEAKLPREVSKASTRVETTPPKPSAPVVVRRRPK
ncbi:MAG: hypothetical protein QM831_45945 [Kofleriaceae bacterium]